MIAIISPAKTLDFDTPTGELYTQPRLPKPTQELIDVLQTKSSQDIQSLMSLSENLATLNVNRYQSFKKRHNLKNSKQCVYAFKGDVYIGLDAYTLKENDIEFAQDHLRILSGLYGLLRPLDLIQPYRLEMGTRLTFDSHKSLYDYWEDQIANLLNKDLKKQGDNVLVNLASNEYFKSVKRKSLKAKIINVEFKDFKNGQFKVISFFAKKARGMMSRYIIQNKINQVEALKGFDTDGYYYDAQESTPENLLFKRG